LVSELTEIAPSATVYDNNGILKQEVEAAISKLKDNKSPGNDKVTAEMIKHGGKAVVTELHEVCNAIWESDVS